MRTRYLSKKEEIREMIIKQYTFNSWVDRLFDRLFKFMNL
jgi:hypothetical protein